jgi:hypothetical protein
MDCPPTLEPVAVVSTDGGEARRAFFENKTRLVLVVDRNDRTPGHWMSAGEVRLVNKRIRPAWVTYRRKVKMPKPVDSGFIGWTESCWVKGTLTLTIRKRLGPGEEFVGSVYGHVLLQ